MFAYTSGLSLASGSQAASIVAMAKSSAAPVLADAEAALVSELALSTNTNLAMAYLKVQQPDKAVYFANKVSTRRHTASHCAEQLVSQSVLSCRAACGLNVTCVLAAWCVALCCVVAQALALQADNAKALFRRGSAYRLLGRLDESRADLDKAMERTPGDTAVRAELGRLRESEKEAQLKERQHYAGMFDKASKAN